MNLTNICAYKKYQLFWLCHFCGIGGNRYTSRHKEWWRSHPFGLIKKKKKTVAIHIYFSLTPKCSTLNHKILSIEKYINSRKSKCKAILQQKIYNSDLIKQQYIKKKHVHGPHQWYIAKTQLLLINSLEYTIAINQSGGYI